MAAPAATGRRARREQTRAAASLLLAALAALSLAMGGTLLYLKKEVSPERPFAARLVSSLDDPAVRGVVAQRAVDALLAGPAGDLLPFRPLLLVAVERVTETERFRRALTFGIADAHRALVTGEGSITLEAGRTARLLLSAVRSLSPAVARRTSGDPRPLLARVDRDNVLLRILRALEDRAQWAWPLLALALLAAAGSLVAAPDRRRALVHGGAALVGAGALVVGIVWVGERVAVGYASRTAFVSGDRERRALEAIWEALFADLRSAGLVVAGCGLLLAAIAAGLGSAPVTGAARLRARARVVRLPAAVRHAGLVALGAAFLIWPGLVARALVVAAGAALVVAGAGGAAARLRDRLAARRPPPDDAEAPARPGARAVALGAGAAALVALSLTGAAAIAFDVPPLPAPPAAPSDGCNGSRANCERRIDEVMWPGTHNSYAASDQPGWFFANQRRDIARQLDAGITALMLDVHWGVSAERGVVRTDFRAEGADANKVVRGLNRRQRRAAERVAGRIGARPADGSPELYLCHTLCELGAEPLSAELSVIRRHLDREPGAVLMLIVEDYVPPSSVRGALDAAGLLEQAAELDRAEPLPTLGELVRGDRRLIVMAEKQGGAYPWYPPAFSFVQDTPLGNRSGADFTCARFRGNADSPVLLVNHWIDRFPPRPSDNARVGGSFLSKRAAACARERGTGPGVVAVDFYERSGVLALARRTNGR